MKAYEQTATEFFTVQEVATKLSMSSSLVYRLIEQGKITTHRIGTGRGRIRIASEDLHEFLATCRHQCQKPEKKRSPRRKLKHLQL